jgi:hypothetical protein
MADVNEWLTSRQCQGIIDGMRTRFSPQWLVWPLSLSILLLALQLEFDSVVLQILTGLVMFATFVAGVVIAAAATRPGEPAPSDEARLDDLEPLPPDEAQ